jgi:plasmid maintenance system killer protein
MSPIPFVLALLPATATPASSDSRAVAIAEQVMEALGGEAAWKKTRYLRFDFAVESEGKIAMSRSHYWDKWTGRYRVEGKTKEGKSFLVLMNLNTRQGQAWLEGKPASADALKEQLDRAWAMWVNDTYWLLMPYKLRDPGVTLALAGEDKVGDAACDKLALTFEAVGLTPKDRYWIFVNRATHMVDRWEYVLQDEKGGPTRWEWRGWRAYGAIQLAPERINEKAKRRILFPVLDVPASIPDTVFESQADR